MINTKYRMLMAAGAISILSLTGCAAAVDTVEAGDPGLPTVAEQVAVTAGPLDEFVDETNQFMADNPGIFPDMIWDVYSDISIEAEGSSTMVYRYTFASPVDAAEARAAASATEPMMTGMAEGLFPQMRAYGIDSPAVKVVYANPDGTELASFTVTS